MRPHSRRPSTQTPTSGCLLLGGLKNPRFTVHTTPSLLSRILIGSLTFRGRGRPRFSRVVQLHRKPPSSTFTIINHSPFHPFLPPRLFFFTPSCAIWCTSTCHICRIPPSRRRILHLSREDQSLITASLITEHPPLYSNQSLWTAVSRLDSSL